MIKYAPLTDEMEKINSKLSTLKKNEQELWQLQLLSITINNLRRNAYTSGMFEICSALKPTVLNFINGNNNQTSKILYQKFVRSKQPLIFRIWNILSTFSKPLVKIQ